MANARGQQRHYEGQQIIEADTTWSRRPLCRAQSGRVGRLPRNEALNQRKGRLSGLMDEITDIGGLQYS